MRVLQPIYFYKKQLLIAGFASLGFLLLLNIFAVAGKNSAKATGQGNKILTVFESGQKTSFKTNAKTVREALKAQKINFSKEDSVEPGLDEELTGAEYSINIYRAKPVVIEDGELKTKILTAAQTPHQIAEKAGLNVHNEDKLAFEESGNILEDGSINTLKITRAKEISVDLFGKTESFRTQAKTVEDFLKEKKIVLGKDDGISIDLKTQISNGLNFRIWRNGKQTLTVEEPTDFQTEIKAAKKQVVIVGTKTSLPAGSHTDWMSAAGISASDYGYVDYIITKESTWRPTARNGQYYGLYQTSISNLNNHGCSGSTLSDPICQLRSASIYATSRYGSWAAAYAHWKASHSW